jgi:hypothetical protein
MGDVIWVTPTARVCCWYGFAVIPAIARRHPRRVSLR